MSLTEKITRDLEKAVKSRDKVTPATVINSDEELKKIQELVRQII